MQKHNHSIGVLVGFGIFDCLFVLALVLFFFLLVLKFKIHEGFMTTNIK